MARAARASEKLSTPEEIAGTAVSCKTGFDFNNLSFKSIIMRSADFFPMPLTFVKAELSPEEKNAISHRGKALRAIAEYLIQ